MHIRGASCRIALWAQAGGPAVKGAQKAVVLRMLLCPCVLLRCRGTADRQQTGACQAQRIGWDPVCAVAPC